MNGQVGFAIIGFGMISHYHTAAISATPNARLAGFYDTSASIAGKSAQAHRVRAYASLEDIWDDENVDAVSICTPSGLHGTLALEAIRHKKHVLIEKPIALTLEDCDRIIETARLMRVKVCVVSQLRFSQAVRQAGKLIQSGALGRLVSADLYMKYYRSQEYYDSSSWRGTWAMDGGGALMNQGIHGIDVLQYLAGPVSSIFARSRTLARRMETEDAISAVVEYQNGALGVIQATTSVYPGFPRRIELCGDHGVLILEEDCIVHAEFDHPVSVPIIQGGVSAAGSHRNPEDISAEGHTRQVTNLVNAILYDEPLLVDGIEGRKAVRLILGAYQSVRQNTPVTFS